MQKTTKRLSMASVLVLVFLLFNSSVSSPAEAVYSALEDALYTRDAAGGDSAFTVRLNLGGEGATHIAPADYALYTDVEVRGGTKEGHRIAAFVFYDMDTAQVVLHAPIPRGDTVVFAMPPRNIAIRVIFEQVTLHRVHVRHFLNGAHLAGAVDVLYVSLGFGEPLYVTIHEIIANAIDGKIEITSQVVYLTLPENGEKPEEIALEAHWTYTAAAGADFSHFKAEQQQGQAQTSVLVSPAQAPAVRTENRVHLNGIAFANHPGQAQEGNGGDNVNGEMAAPSPSSPFDNPRQNAPNPRTGDGRHFTGLIISGIGFALSAIWLLVIMIRKLRS